MYKSKIYKIKKVFLSLVNNELVLNMIVKNTQYVLGYTGYNSTEAVTQTFIENGTGVELVASITKLLLEAKVTELSKLKGLLVSITSLDNQLISCKLII